MQPNDSVTLWLTKDSEGTLIWRHRPKLCVANDLYFQGGECMKLADVAFPNLRQGAVIRVEVKQVQ